jgi:hypothetical protein
VSQLSWQRGQCLRFTDVASEGSRITAIDLRSLPPDTALTIDTRHTSYRVVKGAGWGGRALVQGGAFFCDETEARVDGSTAGGSLIKIGWICVGLRLEISVGRRRFVTSPVRSIRVEALGVIDELGAYREGRDAAGRV